MKKSDVVAFILKDKSSLPIQESACAFAATNIALCKYWGKRNLELNLPVTNSLSVSLADKGAQVKFTLADQDRIVLNNEILSNESGFSQRLLNFINLFRDAKTYFHIDIESNIPIAAGLASSACGFAALTLALNELYQWQLPPKELSILARLGSGSAARSIETGFVEWHKGETQQGFDSFAEKFDVSWPDLCIGLHIIDKNEKKISSREAMRRTVETSQLYAAWPKQVAEDLHEIKQAIQDQDLARLGKSAERNALAMHATMLAAWPAIQYATPETILAMRQIWQLRNEGLQVYFTQDAGPNLKLIFLQKDKESIQKHFNNIQIVNPFTMPSA